MKYLVATLINGERWGYPAERIARNRAEYYVDTDPDTTYQTEYDYTLSDDDTVQEWAHQMNVELDTLNWVKLDDYTTFNHKEMLQYAVTECGPLGDLIYRLEKKGALSVEDV